eukprot:669589-Prymnesium_polylepis.1
MPWHTNALSRSRDTECTRCRHGESAEALRERFAPPGSFGDAGGSHGGFGTSKPSCVAAAGQSRRHSTR